MDASLLFPPDPDNARKARRDPDATMHAHTHEQFQTTALEYPGIVDADALEAELSQRGSLRVKGFVQGPDGVLVVQGVGPRVEVVPSYREVPEHLVGTVVVIERETA